MNKQMQAFFSTVFPTVLLSLSFTTAGLAAFALPSQAQDEKSSELVAICEYDSSSGFRNPLDSGSSLAGSAFITVEEYAEGHSVFTYVQEPSIVLVDDALANATGNPLLSSVRTLLLNETPLEIARQQLIDSQAYYAELLGISVEALGDRTFAEVDQTLSCREATALADDPAADPADDPADTPEEAPGDNGDTPQGTLDALPDGNYRVTSADLPFRVITTEELLESGGTVFLFKKVGNAVSGDFFYPETDSSICIEGTLEGDVVTGRAKLDGTEATIPDSDALSVSNQSMGGRFINAMLDLTAFSRINAGTVLPRERCS